MEKAEQNLEARKHAANRTRQRSFRCGQGKVIFYEASQQERWRSDLRQLQLWL